MLKLEVDVVRINFVVDTTASGDGGARLKKKAGRKRVR